MSLWVSQGSYQRLEEAALPSAPSHYVQKALGWAWKTPPCSFLFTPNTAAHSSGSRPLTGSPVSRSLFAFWLTAVLWVLLGTPAPPALDCANIISKQRSQLRNPAKLDRASVRCGEPLDLKTHVFQNLGNSTPGIRASVSLSLEWENDTYLTEKGGGPKAQHTGGALQKSAPFFLKLSRFFAQRPLLSTYTPHKRNREGYGFHSEILELRWELCDPEQVTLPLSLRSAICEQG